MRKKIIRVVIKIPCDLNKKQIDILDETAYKMMREYFDLTERPFTIDYEEVD